MRQIVLLITNKHLYTVIAFRLCSGISVFRNHLNPNWHSTTQKKNAPQNYKFNQMILFNIIQYSLANPIYIESRYRRITENDGLLGKVGTNLLSRTVQHRSFKIII